MGDDGGLDGMMMGVRGFGEFLTSRSWLMGWFQPQIYKLGLAVILFFLDPRREELGC